MAQCLRPSPQPVKWTLAPAKLCVLERGELFVDECALLEERTLPVFAFGLSQLGLELLEATLVFAERHVGREASHDLGNVLVEPLLEGVALEDEQDRQLRQLRVRRVGRQ